MRIYAPLCTTFRFWCVNDASNIHPLFLTFFEGDTMKKSNSQLFKDIVAKRPRALHTLTNRSLKGDYDACYHLAFAHLKNCMTEQGKTNVEAASKGIAFLQRAACGSHAGALFALGKLHLHGVVLAQNPQKGHSFIELASHAGHSDAQGLVSQNILTNATSDEDVLTAIQLAEISANHGSAEGDYALGHCAYHKLFPDKQKNQNFMAFLEKSAEKGNAKAMYALFNAQLESKQIPELALLHKAAEKSHLLACQQLALCYLTGKHISQNMAKACIYYKFSQKEAPPLVNQWLANCGEGYQKEVELELMQRRTAQQQNLIASLHRLN